jgi:hypothetical protein
MKHECPRCGYETNDLHNLRRHLDNKTICLPSKSDISIDEIKANLKTFNKVHQCSHCDKSFSHTSSLCRHVKDTHPSIEANTSIHNETNAHSHNTTNTNTTNTNTNNTNNHSFNTTNNTNSHNNTTINNPIININVFGKEDLEHILNDPEFIVRCLEKRLTSGIPDLIEKMSFNPEVPENHNVKHEKKHYQPKVKVYTENGWESQFRDEVVLNLVKKGTDIIIDNANEHIITDCERYTPDENDYRAKRQQDLIFIKQKKKGVYGPIKRRMDELIETKG